MKAQIKIYIKEIRVKDIYGDFLLFWGFKDYWNFLRYLSCGLCSILWLRFLIKPNSSFINFLIASTHLIALHLIEIVNFCSIWTNLPNKLCGSGANDLNKQQFFFVVLRKCKWIFLLINIKRKNNQTNESFYLFRNHFSVSKIKVLKFR